MPVSNIMDTPVQYYSQEGVACKGAVRLICMVKIYLLWILNAILLRRMRIKHISFTDIILIVGNYTTLNINSRGCYKIKVHTRGYLLGNSKQFNFQFNDIDKPFRLTFYGISKKKSFDIQFNGSKVDLIEKFNLKNAIPLICDLDNFGPIKNKIKIPVINIKLNNLQANIESIEKINFD